MNKPKLNGFQICALFIAICPLIKLITAPAVFAGYCGEKLWQPLLINFSADLLLLFLCMHLSKKYQNLTFFEILTKRYSLTFAKIIFLLYALFFTAKAVIPLIEQKEFIENAFYETLPQAPVFYPIFIVIFFIAIKGYTTLGRTGQIGLFISGAGLLLILFLSIPTADFKKVLPLFAFSNKNTPICALNALSWFNDGIYLLFFTGYFKRKKSTFKYIFLSYAIMAVIIILYFVTFYSIFSYIAPTQELALNSMSIFGVTLVNVGRFDYVALFLLAMTGAIACALPVVIATNCISESFSLKSKIIPASAITLFLLVIMILFSAKYEEVLSFSSKYLTPFYLLCGYILPLLTLGGKKIEQQKS